MAKKIKKISDLVFDKKNINKGSEYGTYLLEKSLKELGAGRSVLADKNGVLIAGNKTVEKFHEIGMDKIKVVETDGNELVVVQRVDLDINSAEGAKMKILDNTVSKHNYIEDVEVAEAVCEEFEIEAVELGLTKPFKEDEDIDKFFVEIEQKKDNKYHIILKYNEEEYKIVQEALKKYTGTVEEIFLSLLTSE
jgi:hypothetical protein